MLLGFVTISRGGDTGSLYEAKAHHLPLGSLNVAEYETKMQSDDA